MQVLPRCYREESLSSTPRKAAPEAAGRIRSAGEGEGHRVLWLSAFSWPAAAL